MSKDYCEILLESVDQIVLQRLSEISFDETVVCTIIDHSEKDMGKYKVTNGSSVFDAYSDNTNYTKNTQVYVHVPMGDWSSRKTILSKYRSEDDLTPIGFVKPLESIVALETFEMNSTAKLIANGDVSTIEIGSISRDDNNSEKFDNFILCGAIGVSAEFRSLLRDMSITAGTYGLQIQIDGKNDEGGEYRYIINFDSNTVLFGNPYSYDVFVEQQQTYKLPEDLTAITKITAVFFQDNNFKRRIGLGETVVLEAGKAPNLLVRNLKLICGYDVSKIDNNTAEIVTSDIDTYDPINRLNIEKTLKLIWFNKDENNKYLGFTDGSFGTLSDAQDSNKSIYHITWERNNFNGQWSSALEGSENNTIVTLPIVCTDEVNEFRARVVFQGRKYYSNVITFRSTSALNSTHTATALSLALFLKHGKYSQDAYPFYGPSGTLINPSESSRTRELYYTYDSKYGESLSQDILNGAKAYFYIPTIGTMLDKPHGMTENIISEQDKYYKEGFVGYKYDYADAFQLMEFPVNLLKNTSPKELLGKGNDYNYGRQIDFWSEGVQARSTSNGEKAIMLKDSESTSLIARQKIKVDIGQKYTFSSQIWSNNASADIGLKIYYKLKDNETEQVADIADFKDLEKDKWHTISKTFSLDDSYKEAVEMYIGIQTNNANYTLLYQTQLEVGENATAWTYAPSEQEAAKEELQTFKYRIQNNYNPLFANNTVFLKLVDKNGFEYDTNMTFVFSSYGTSGIDYSIVISEKNGYIAQVKDVTDYTLQAKLYNANGEEVIDGVSWDWNAEFQENTTTFEKNYAQFGYPIAEARTTVNYNDKFITASAIYPISYADNDTIMYQGPTIIIYDVSGVKPEYYPGDICLFKKETNEIIDAEWELLSIDTGGEEKTTDLYDFSLAPSAKTGKPRLEPATMFLSNKDIRLILRAKSLEDDTILWRQPLIIMQNKYSSSVLNGWNGKMLINNDDNYILSAMMGAGTKDRENKFTGVLMGQIGTENDATPDTGLFGYISGAQSFGFNANGTAFIGQAGKGRIQFDGNRGIIASSSWYTKDGVLKTSLESTESGIKIDLDDGHLYAKSSDNNYLYFDNDGLKIKVSDANLIIGDATIGAQIGSIEASVSNKLDATGNSGSSFGWSLTANGFYIDDSDSPSATNYVLSVDSNGLKVKGEVFATSGKIGDWTLSSNGLSYGSQYYFYRVWPDSDTVTIGSQSKGKNWRIVMGRNGAVAKFGVDKDGRLFAESAALKSASISGNLQAQYIDFSAANSADELSLYQMGRYTGNTTVSYQVDITISEPDARNEATVTGTLSTAPSTEVRANFKVPYVNTSGANASKSIMLTFPAGSKIAYSTIPNVKYIISTPDSVGATVTNAVASVALNASFVPSTTAGSHHLGTSDYRWNTIYLKAQPNVSSDERLKNIEQIDAKFNAIYDDLNPIKYKWKDDCTQYHFGFGAQAVQNAFIKGGAGDEKYSLIGTEGAYMSLSYSEFIALNTWQIQQLKKRVADLEAQLKEKKE